MNRIYNNFEHQSALIIQKLYFNKLFYSVLDLSLSPYLEQTIVLFLVHIYTSQLLIAQVNYIQWQHLVVYFQIFLLYILYPNKWSETWILIRKAAIEDSMLSKLKYLLHIVTFVSIYYLSKLCGISWRACSNADSKTLY